MKIGFIGLGIMGKPMAKNLLKAGHKVICYDINTQAVKEVGKAGAVMADSIKETVSGTGVVITMLPNSPEVKEVVLGKDGVLENAAPGTILIDMSSIDPIVTKQISDKLAEKKVIMIDAPVSGGEPKAIDGTLSIMAGGPEKEFEKVKEILLLMGSNAVLVGEIGSGNVTKLSNQIIVALNIAAMSEAMTLAVKAGVDPKKVFEAIRGGLAGSTVLDAKMPLVLKGDFKPGFRMELHIKDLMNALNAAHELGAPVPLAAQVMEMMQTLKADGKSKDDHGGLVQYYEKLSGSMIRETPK